MTLQIGVWKGSTSQGNKRAVREWVIVVIKVTGKEGFSYCNANKAGVCFKQWNSVPLGICQVLAFLLPYNLMR